MNKYKSLISFMILIPIFSFMALSQTPTFTYQGKLSDTGAPPTGTYQMEFRLFDAVSGGAQIGSLITNGAVAVTQGVFTVNLNFDAAAFPGADRFLQISVRRNAGEGFVTLNPRQQIASSPYSIQSLNAATATNSLQLGGSAANQFVQTNDARLSDSRDPLSGSSNYVQNTTTTQAAANFNIDGTGTANVLNAAMHFSIGGNRVMSTQGTNNFFGGVNAGAAITTGTANAFFGRNSGQANTTGTSNSFFGYNSGAGTTTGGNNTFTGDAAGFVTGTGSNNSFYGSLAGFNNTASANSFFGGFAGQNNQIGTSNSFFGFVAGLNNLASSNSFFGRGAGFTNSSGTRNAFFGMNASDLNTSGSDNSAFGFNAGKSNTTGARNVFVGAAAGFVNTLGGNNTLIGSGSDVTVNNLDYAAAIGSGSAVGSSDTIVLGKAAGTYNGVPRPADTIRVPGTLNISGALGASILNAATQYNLGGNRILIGSGTNLFAGIDAGLSNTTGTSNTFFGQQAGRANTGSCCNSFFGDKAGLNSTGPGNAFFGNSAGLNNTTANQNSFFGSFAGVGTNTGAFNSFFGYLAGNSNTGGTSNSFFGRQAGFTTNTTGSNLTLIGADTGVGLNNLTNATAIGSAAWVTQSNSLVLGGISGVNGGTSVNVGIGTTAPASRLDVRGNIQIGNVTNTAALNFATEALFVNNDGGHASNTFRVDAANNNLFIIGRSDPGATAGTGIIFRTAAAGAGEGDRVVINSDGTVRLNHLGDATASSLCFNNALLTISFCSSSRRYKTDIETYTGGLDLLQRFRPVEFTWKEGGKRDVGFIAEEVAAIEPLLTFNNPKGELQGVEYAQITTILVNSIKEQQDQIAELTRQIAGLKKLICAANVQAEGCTKP